MRLCVVPGCKSGAQAPGHKFPKAPALSELWIEAVKVKELYNIPSAERTRYRVCHTHFSEDAYRCDTQRRALKKDAIPSLNLPKEYQIEYNVKIEIDMQPTPSIENLECIPDIISLALQENQYSRTDRKSIQQILNETEGTPTRYFEGNISLEETQDDQVHLIHDSNMEQVPEQAQNIEYKDEILNIPVTECKDTDILSEDDIRREKEKENGYSIEQNVQLKYQPTNIHHIFISDFINQYDDSLRTHEVLHNYNMPSPKPLKCISRKVSLKPGICDIAIQYLHQKARTMHWHEKYCILMWDEMTLASHVDYDISNDVMIGFEDWGKKRTNKFADHTLVFMLQGLKSGWKMPILVGYCESETKAPQLISCIKDIVKAVTRSGFKIVATVCDQGSSNVAAINLLLQDTAKRRRQQDKQHRNTIELHGTEIISFFDPSNLIKAVRNNLLTKDLEIEISSNVYKRIFASWKCLELAYNIDIRKNALNRMLPEITDEHIIPNKINKMRVKCARQIFSKHISAYIQLLSDIKGYIETEMGRLKMFKREGTAMAKVLNFFNDLLDSVNGDTKDSNIPLQRIVTDNSAHHKFWSFAITELKNMRYVEPSTKLPIKRSLCLKSWIKTIYSFQDLWKMLRSNGFKRLRTHYISLDSLENFFECIKVKRCRNTNPTCTEVQAAYKTLLKHTLSWRYSNGQNKTKNILLKAKFKQCILCQFTVSKDSEFKKEIYAKMRRVVYRCIDNLHYRFKIKEKIKTVLEKKFDFNFIYCGEHYEMLKTSIINFVIIICINRWCNTINNTLNGKDIIKHKNPIMVQAQQKYRMKLRKRNM